MTMLCMLFSSMVLADRVVIRGSPVVVDERAGVYVPRTAIPVTPNVDHYYFTVGDKQRVCYPKENPTFVNLNGGVVKVRVGDGDVPLHCYDYNPDYFVVQ